MAITTLFDGIEYRSRLEAKWGAFFTRLGWHFTYEPFDGDGYIPDFLIHGPRPFLVEVKPAATREQYEAPIPKIIHGVRQHWEHDILIVGVDPLPTFRSESWAGNPVAGLLGEASYEGDWWFSAALWSLCHDCVTPHLSIWHDTGNYVTRPCSRGRGDKQWNNGRDTIASAWAEATNNVKWRGREAPKTPPPTPQPATPLHLWEQVIHPQFGKGLIIAVEQAGTANEAITIDFGVHTGSKKLLTRYAPLRRIGGAA